MHSFEIRDQFYLDGAPFKIISGAIHYFRVVPEYWQDRLQKLAALGCNAVETYVPWNLHEPREGQFDFAGMLDLVRFLKTAQALGLYAIVRPSPYICAEWEFGGLPAWLTTKPEMALRVSEGPFLSHVKRYYERLMPLLTPLQVNRGGPIILMQIENEYGYYGDDKDYLAALRDMMRALGVDVPLITSDGPTDDCLRCGGVDGALPTANFGSKAEDRLSVLKRHVGEGPLMCTEFWVGWFDHWGSEHHQTDVAESTEELRAILAQGSVNIYMFHGGTNFGFMNGANYYGKRTSDVTSYDYDALLTEDGRITPKYRAFQQVIKGYRANGSASALPAEIERKAYGEVGIDAALSLYDALDAMPAPVWSAHPQSMEALGESYGYVFYRTQFKEAVEIEKFRLWRANDRAQVFLDRNPVATLYDRDLCDERAVHWQGASGGFLDILVENMGRVNFGVHMQAQQKGIAGDVLLNERFHTGWQQYALPMTPSMLKDLPFQAQAVDAAPAFFRFKFEVDKACDTFLDMTGWGKGCVMLNGFVLGRFWSHGPQKRLYVPAPLLRQGPNELIVFETEGVRAQTIAFRDEPDLG